MCAKTSGDRMWPASSRRFRSFQAGSPLGKPPGGPPTPYQPTPNPSPFVVSAPSRECRLWSINPCGELNSSSSMITGWPCHAIHLHMRGMVSAGRSRRITRLGRCAAAVPGGCSHLHLLRRRAMTTQTLEELGPVDIVVIGYPADAPMTGSAADALIAEVEKG